MCELHFGQILDDVCSYGSYEGFLRKSGYYAHYNESSIIPALNPVGASSNTIAWALVTPLRDAIFAYAFL